MPGVVAEYVAKQNTDHLEQEAYDRWVVHQPEYIEQRKWETEKAEFRNQLAGASNDQLAAIEKTTRQDRKEYEPELGEAYLSSNGSYEFDAAPEYQGRAWKHTQAQSAMTSRGMDVDAQFKKELQGMSAAEIGDLAKNLGHYQEDTKGQFKLAGWNSVDVSDAKRRLPIVQTELAKQQSMGVDIEANQEARDILLNKIEQKHGPTEYSTKGLSEGQILHRDDIYEVQWQGAYKESAKELKVMEKANPGIDSVAMLAKYEQSIHDKQMEAHEDLYSQLRETRSPEEASRWMDEQVKNNPAITAPEMLAKFEADQARREPAVKLTNEQIVSEVQELHGQFKSLSEHYAASSGAERTHIKEEMQPIVEREKELRQEYTGRATQEMSIDRDDVGYAR